MTEIQKQLLDLRDEKYREFNSALIPNIDRDTVIGVRTPALRKLAKEMIKSGGAEEFISTLPHRYFEENQLHAFIIAEEKDFRKCLERVKAFLPFINNWATCDQLSPKCFYKNAGALLPDILKWLGSRRTYETRFGIVCLMRYFLDEKFDSKQSERIAEIRSDEYYIKMAVAWYFSTALAKQYDKVFPFLAENRLDIWTHNKAIQKATESYRISDEQKDILKRMKV